MTVEISKVLVLSTAHVTEDTATALNETDCKAWPCTGGLYCEYGWFISSRPTGREDLPEDLAKVMEFAREAGCSYILFDRDAGKIDDLPTHDW